MRITQEWHSRPVRLVVDIFLVGFALIFGEEMSSWGASRPVSSVGAVVLCVLMLLVIADVVLTKEFVKRSDGDRDPSRSSRDKQSDAIPERPKD